MSNILDFIAKETNSKNYKSYKYCIESIDVPKLQYDDKQDIIVKKIGETDKGLKTSKSLKNYALRIQGNPLFKYFLDGSRRTYKVDDIAFNNKIYPVIAGQIGVGVCFREDKDTFKSFQLHNPLAISLPSVLNAGGNNDELFFNQLLDKINHLEILQKQKIEIEKIIPYRYNASKEDDKYEAVSVAQMSKVADLCSLFLPFNITIANVVNIRKRKKFSTVYFVNS